MKIISCIGPGGWDLYGKRFVESFIEHFRGVPLTLYHHDEKFEPIANPNVTYVDLIEVDDEIVEWRAKHTDPMLRGVVGEQYNFRYDALKFSNKVFALGHFTAQLVHEGYNDWLVWLDADTFATKEIDEDWLKSHLPAASDIVHLPRKTLPYSETSFVGFNFARNEAKILIADLRSLYIDGEIFNYKEWHDGWLFSRLLYIHNYNGLKDHSLTPVGYDGIDAFEHSALGERLVHLKGDRKKPKPRGRVPLRIKPVDSMPAEHIQKSARASEKLLTRWLKLCNAHDRELIIASAGETLQKHLGEIKRRQRAGSYVLAVKHSLPTLIAAGIEPDGVIILDPRNVKEKSTHGIVRTSLFDVVPKKTTFFVATMTDTSVVKHLQKKTKKIVGWVAWTQALKNMPPKAGQLALQGGTCAAWRAFHLGHALGFRKLRCYGFDFVVDEKKVDMEVLDEKGRKKYMKIFIGAKQRKEITTGELCAGIQDVNEMLQRANGSGLDVTMIGDRGAAFAWNDAKHKLPKPPKVKLVDFEKEYGK